jgi:lipoate-protein ligase A
MMEKYLKHPTKEPDYRKGRSHKDFVSSLKESGYDIEPLYLKKQLDTYFSAWDFTNNQAVK